MATHQTNVIYYYGLSFTMDNCIFKDNINIFTGKFLILSSAT